MLSRPRKPPSNTLWPEGSLRFTHQVKFSSNFAKLSCRNGRSTSPRSASRFCRNRAAKAWTGGFTSPKFHFIGGDWPPGPRYSRDSIRSILLFCEVGVDHGQRNAMERQVPGGVPRVLPLVRHGHHVVVEHMEPRLVARAPPGRRTQGVEVALTQPAVHIEVIALLGPQHPRQGLAHDRLRIVGQPTGARWRRRTRPPRPAARRSAHPRAP